MLKFELFVDQLRQLPKIVQLLAIEKFPVDQLDLEKLLMTQISSADTKVKGVDEINFIGRELALRVPTSQLSIPTLLKAQESSHIDVRTLAAELIMKHFPEYLTPEMTIMIAERCICFTTRNQAIELLHMFPKEKFQLEALLKDLNHWDDFHIEIAFTLILKHFPEHLTLQTLLNLQDSFDETIRIRAKEFALTLPKEKISLDILLLSLENDTHDLVVLVRELAQKHFSTEMEEMFRTQLKELELI